ncbi:MAG: threonine synthase, partial [Candidatus Bipolaricaulota bacterium]|nr:threonine synthase [Candidatus Bipolaricaulota bacterium]
MGEPLGFRCVGCGRTYRPWEHDYLCPRCGPVAGALDVVYDYPALGRGEGEFPRAGSAPPWRYGALLPVGEEHAVPLRSGGTPLYPLPRLAAELGLRALWVKDDTLHPTGSCKDRGTALAVAAARKLGRSAVACASTGNAASSLAGFAAAAGIPCYIFVPKAAPPAKVAQLLAYGATVFRVDGTYDQAYALALEACDRFGWYNRSDGQNPTVVEGNKTAAFEVAEELGWEVPDYALVSVGDGSVVAGIAKGFRELRMVGLSDGVPAVYGVQAEGAAAVAHAHARLRAGEPVLPTREEARTIADSIRVGEPRDALRAVQEVEATGGGFVSVSDREIVGAVQE